MLLREASRYFPCKRLCRVKQQIYRRGEALRDAVVNNKAAETGTHHRSAILYAKLQYKKWGMGDPLENLPLQTLVYVSVVQDFVENKNRKFGWLRLE